MHSLDPRLLRRTRSARPLLVIDTLLGIGTGVVVLLQATLLARVVARAFAHGSLHSLELDLGLLLFAFALRGALTWGMEIAGRHAARSILSELRLALVSRRLRGQPMATDSTGGAEIAAVAVQGVDALEAYFSRYLPQVVLACVVPLLVVTGVALVDLESALVMLVTLPLVPVFMWLIGRYTETRTRERWQALRQLACHFLDVVRGLPTLRSHGRAADEVATLAAVGERYRRATMQTLRVSFLSGSVLELAATLGVALVAVVAGVRLVDGRLGLQAGLTVLVLAPELYVPFRRLGSEFHASADGLAIAERMLALIDAPASAVSGGARLAPSPAKAAIRFERVSYSYPARSALVLDALDLQLSAGETVALVGESGAGKSTVAALLLGLIAPTSGRISVGSVALESCRIDAWRRHVAWLPQNPALLRGTVADNIWLGNPGASYSAVVEAACLAGADEFIATLPDGFRTRVGEGGRSLSPGQRRRLGLARAFLKDAPLIILDEPTADLDPFSVAIVANAIRHLERDRTILVIAHRRELVEQVDRTIRLEGGAVIAEPERRVA